MKANELRIGNYIQKDGNPIQVSWATIRLLDEGHNVGDPIPLTEEWLGRFGFKQSTTAKNIWQLPYSKEAEWCVISFNTYMKFEFWFGSHGNKFEFVHQLQNLYFALTGNELEFNK